MFIVNVVFDGNVIKSMRFAHEEWARAWAREWDEMGAKECDGPQFVAEVKRV